MTSTEKEITLTQGQRDASDQFFNFLFSADREMIISGGGGVGKSRLMGHMIDRIMPEYLDMCVLMGAEPEYTEVVMTATTNKAVEVLSLATGRPVETIHSFLRLKVQDNFDTGRSKLIKTNQFTVHQKKIIFIDECSMIDTALYQMIQEATLGCKVVYVGDHCQLAPVTETLSPIYTKGLPFCELTEPVRNADQPALMAICQQLRNTVETGIFKPIQLVPGVIDHVTDEDEMEALIEQHFMVSDRNKRVLVYTNARVNDYNNHIRGVRGLPHEYQLGEQLISNSVMQVGPRRMTIEEELEITYQARDTEDTVIFDNGDPEMLVTIKTRRSHLRNRLGNSYENVRVPVNRDHYASLIRYYSKEKNWGRYFWIKNNMPDLRSRDASTIHKAQGSTHDIVFIDLDNLSTCHIPGMAARLLYVAFTRARSRIILYGELAAKYGGLVT